MPHSLFFKCRVSYVVLAHLGLSVKTKLASNQQRYHTRVLNSSVFLGSRVYCRPPAAQENQKQKVGGRRGWVEEEGGRTSSAR